MKLRIEPLGHLFVEAVTAFNARIKGADKDVDFAFPLTEDGLVSVSDESGIVFKQRAYVALDDQAVRGGYILKEERFEKQGADMVVGNYQLPLSEGIANKRYSLVGVQLLSNALSTNKALYCLGMGNAERALPRMLKKLGWDVAYVPFFFKVVRVASFLRNIRYFRSRPGIQRAIDAVRLSGLSILPGLCWKAWTALRAAKIPPEVRIEEIPEFGSKSDAIWRSYSSEYNLLADRGHVALNAKLPPSDKRLHRLLVSRDGNAIGWVVVTLSRLQDHKQFGDMALGCIVDGMCASSDVRLLVRVAEDWLVKHGVDLIVSNQSHPFWVGALETSAYVKGPSNFVLARSPELVACAAGGPQHFNRCDGDGPINL